MKVHGFEVSFLAAIYLAVNIPILKVSLLSNAHHVSQVFRTCEEFRKEKAFNIMYLIGLVESMGQGCYCLYGVVGIVSGFLNDLVYGTIAQAVGFCPLLG